MITVSGTTWKNMGKQNKRFGMLGGDRECAMKLYRNVLGVLLLAPPLPRSMPALISPLSWDSWWHSQVYSSRVQYVDFAFLFFSFLSVCIASFCIHSDSITLF